MVFMVFLSGGTVHINYACSWVSIPTPIKMKKNLCTFIKKSQKPIEKGEGESANYLLPHNLTLNSPWHLPSTVHSPKGRWSTFPDTQHSGCCWAPARGSVSCALPNSFPASSGLESRISPQFPACLLMSVNHKSAGSTFCPWCFRVAGERICLFLLCS